MTKVYNSTLIPTPLNHTRHNKSMDSGASFSLKVNVKKRSKSRDLTKKMGGGQKGLWSKTDEFSSIPKPDQYDPNYDSENDENVILVPDSLNHEKFYFSDPDDQHLPSPILNHQDVKIKIDKIISEYYISGDANEAKQSLMEMESLKYHFEIVKRSISLSLDKHEKEREMTSRLLSELYPDVLNTHDIGKGFKRLFEYADDLELDIPNARPLLSTFLARAVVDEILPPIYLMDPIISKIGGDIVEMAKKKLTIHHGAARLEKGWGPGDGRPVEELKVAIDQLIQEFLFSKDMIEASQCVQELNVPEFHHEVVKRFLINGFESGINACEPISSLMKLLMQNGIISRNQIIKGFERVKTIMSDITLDIPIAPKLFKIYISSGIKDGLLNQSYSF